MQTGDGQRFEFFVESIRVWANAFAKIFREKKREIAEKLSNISNTQVMKRFLKSDSATTTYLQMWPPLAKSLLWDEPPTYPIARDEQIKMVASVIK